MEVPKHILDSIDTIIKAQQLARDLTYLVTQWIEEQGVDTKQEDFMNSIWAKIDYCEIDAIEASKLIAEFIDSEQQ